MPNFDDPTNVNSEGPPDEGRGAGAKKPGEKLTPESETPVDLSKTVVMSSPGKALGSDLRKPADKPAPAAPADETPVDLSKTVVMSSPGKALGSDLRKPAERPAPAAPAAETPVDLSKTVVMTSPGKALGSDLKKTAEKPAPAAPAEETPVDLSKTVVMSSPGKALGADAGKPAAQAAPAPPKPAEKVAPPAPRPPEKRGAAALDADTPIDLSKTVVTAAKAPASTEAQKPAAPAAARPAAPAAAKPGVPRAPSEPKPAAPPAAAAVAAKPPEPNQLRRRLTWTCIVAFLTANLLMFLRFFFPRALFEPSTVSNLGYPSDYVLGVSDRFKQQSRIYVVREPTRIFAVFAKCTHLGCTPDWKPAENKFKCPCHGSGYTPEAINFEGPAPRPMDRAHVELNAQGEIIADVSRLYMWDRSKGGRNEFDDPGAFVPL